MFTEHNTNKRGGDEDMVTAKAYDVILYTCPKSKSFLADFMFLFLYQQSKIKLSCQWLFRTIQ